MTPTATSTSSTRSSSPSKQTTPVPPAIVTHPTDHVVRGWDGNLHGRSQWHAPLTYQWKKNTVDIPLATAASYTTPAVTKADSGARFVCVVTNGLGSVTSNPAMLHVVTLPPVVSILANFSFETGTTPWVFYTNGAGSFDNTPAGSGSPRAGHISIATEGSNVQLYQPGVTLEANTVYTLSFKARSSSGNDVTINVQQHGAPYASYGLNKEFNLTTAWNTYAVEFTTQNFSGTVNDGRSCSGSLPRRQRRRVLLRRGPPRQETDHAEISARATAGERTATTHRIVAHRCLSESVQSQHHDRILPAGGRGGSTRGLQQPRCAGQYACQRTVGRGSAPRNMERTG